MIEIKEKSKGYIKLTLCMMAIWFLGFVALPSLTKISATAQQLADFIDYSEIETGYFYYTGVEIVAHAEMNARSSTQFSQNRKEFLSKEKEKKQASLKSGALVQDQNISTRGIYFFEMPRINY